MSNFSGSSRGHRSGMACRGRGPASRRRCPRRPNVTVVKGPTVRPSQSRPPPRRTGRRDWLESPGRKRAPATRALMDRLPIRRRTRRRFQPTRWPIPYSCRPLPHTRFGPLIQQLLSTPTCHRSRSYGYRPHLSPARRSRQGARRCAAVHAATDGNGRDEVLQAGRPATRRR